MNSAAIKLPLAPTAVKRMRERADLARLTRDNRQPRQSPPFDPSARFRSSGAEIPAPADRPVRGDATGSILANEAPEGAEAKAEDHGFEPSFHVRRHAKSATERRCCAAGFLSLVLEACVGDRLYRRARDDAPVRAEVQTPTSGPGHVRGRSLRSIS